MRENLETFLARSREACIDDDPIPGYVERTFRKYLECGILAHGFARVFCESCRNEYLVAFSCKTRGLCPSCDTRRMAQTAAYLVDHVLARVPMRQWVLSVPKRIRFFLQRDRRAASGVLRIFLREVEGALRRASPGAPKNARFGAVAFLQRFGSALNEHLHYHVVVTDGVFAETTAGEVEFFAAVELDRQGMEHIAAGVRKKVLRYLERRGLLDEPTVDQMLSWEHGGGFSLDGSVRLEGWDRQGLERVLRYCARPAFSTARLGQVQGKVVYSFPKPLSDGRTLLVMDPLEFLARLAKLIPPPRAHQVSYFGVLAPHSRLRDKVISGAGPAPALLERMQQAAEQMNIPPEPKRRASRRWAMLMARIFETLPLLCTCCGSPMRVIAFITEPKTITRILDHLDEPSRPPPLSPARGPPQCDFDYLPA